MTTIQVRLNRELESLVEAAVKSGAYTTKSEVVRDAIRRMFAPELNEKVLRELKIRSKSKRWYTQEEIEKELGI